MTKAAVRVAEFIDQHASGGPYAPLYPLPEPKGSETGDFRVPSTLDMWQFTYPDGAVHGHVMLLAPASPRAYVCATPTNLPLRGVYGTNSRRPARTSTHASTDRYEFGAYLFDRNNDAVLVSDWVLSSNIDVHAVSVMEGDTDISKMTVRMPEPGTDMHFDVGPGYLCADYTLHRRVI